MSDRFMLVVAGPNGSGKSTISGALSEAHDILYICPDNYTHIFSNIVSIEDRYAHAMKAAKQDRLTAVAVGDSFAFETVCSNPEKIAFISDARIKGYKIIVLYISTGDPKINIERVKRRVSEGGHDVPDDKIIERYHRSMSLLPNLLKMADEALVYDNSDDDKRPHLFLKIKRDSYFIYQPVPAWGKKIIESLEDRF